ncbi:YncE family protein, partial [candidate division WOR-3 bacterium]|nr:YncE family protein [candidate division WOR-3 bacterium]
SDTVTYSVFLGPTTTPVLAESGLQVTQYQAHRLNTFTLYYWRVVARDRKGETSSGPRWSFTTGAANSPPALPSSPTPDSAATAVWRKTTLRWTGSDPDPGDTLYFDVHLGLSTPPGLVSQRQRTVSYAATALLYDTTYYWRIVVYDQRGATRTGPLWRFRTCAPLRMTAPVDTTRWPVNSQQSVTWTGWPALPAPDSSVIYQSPDDGSHWYRHGRATSAGRYEWRVPGPVTTTARVQVRMFVAGDTGLGLSGRYQVTDTTPPSPITVTSPTGSSRWVIGSQQNITWTGGTDGMDSTVILYSTNSGMNWTRQGKTLVPDSFAWTVPGPATATAKVAVRAYSLSRMTEGLSANFSVIEAPYPDTVLATVTVGAKPRAMVWDSIDGRVFVANYTDSSVSVISGATNQVLRTIRVGQYPYALCWNSAGNRVYCADYGGNTVTVIDAATYVVLATVPVGRNPSALCWNAVNNKVYAANSRDASVTVINGADNSVITTVDVDSSPTAVVWNQAVNGVYVANFADNSVTVIDGASNGVITTVNVGYSPAALCVDGNDNVAVANRNAGTVSIINAANNSVYTTINVETEPWALCANPDDDRLYVCNSASGSVSVINTQTYGFLQGVTVGAQPRSAAWAAWADKVYVANYDGQSVTILAGPTGNSLKTVPVGRRPIAVCVNRTDNRVYVANYDDGTVSVIGAIAR